MVFKKKTFQGEVLIAYLGWYGFGRMFIEGLRTDSLYIGAFRISQVVGFLCFVICSVLWVYLYLRARRKRLDAESYDSVFEGVGTAPTLTVKKEGLDAAEGEIERIIQATAEHQNTGDSENGNLD